MDACRIGTLCPYCPVGVEFDAGGCICHENQVPAPDGSGPRCYRPGAATVT